MRAGTIIRLPDGREGTVVYKSLDGYGIKWGRYLVDDEDIKGHGSLFCEPLPEGYEWSPDAMLRDSYPGAGLPCVGEDYEIVKE